MNKPFAAAIAAIFLTFTCGGGASGDPAIAGEELAGLEKVFESKPGSLSEFFTALEQKSSDARVRRVSRAFLKSKRGQAESGLGPGDRITLYRLLGLFTRVRYEAEMIALLGRLVALPTFKRGELPQHNNPAILRMGQLLAEEAQRFGFQFRNVDNRIYEIVLPGTTKEDFGIYTHGDVVPAIPEMWKLPKGQRLDPFRLRVEKDRIYGRGTEDDKGSIVTALYAMHAIQEAGLPVRRTIRLLIETTEETGGEGMEYYKARHPLPTYNVVLDSSYPVVTAEKGYGVLRVRFARIPKDLPPAPSPAALQQPTKTAPAPGSTGKLTAEITSIEGAAAVNQIPEQCVIRLATKQPKKLAARMRSRAKRYRKQDKKIKIDVGATDRDVLLRFRGISAHSSQPEQGLNPVSRALSFLAQNEKAFGLENNAFLAAAQFSYANFGTDDYGKKLDVAYSDDFMGPFTATVTQIRDEGQFVELNVNVRMPRGRNRDELINELRTKLEAHGRKASVAFDLDIRIEEPMVRDADRPWIRTLLDVYAGVTGKPAKPVAAAGATTARQLPNGVNFGPSLPGEKYRGHTALEYKRRDNLLLDAQLFTEMLLRIANLEKME